MSESGGEDSKRKYEYEHYDLGYGMHFGRHSLFGPHVAIGKGSNMVHVYPYKVFIADEEVPLSPGQRRVVSDVLKALELRVAGATRPVDKIVLDDPLGFSGKKDGGT